MITKTKETNVVGMTSEGFPGANSIFMTSVCRSSRKLSIMPGKVEPASSLLTA